MLDVLPISPLLASRIIGMEFGICFRTDSRLFNPSKPRASKNEILALIIRSSFKKKGIEFFTPNDNSLQVGYMNRPKEYTIKPHIHYQIPRTVNTLQEVLFIKKEFIFSLIKLNIFIRVSVDVYI